MCYKVFSWCLALEFSNLVLVCCEHGESGSSAEKRLQRDLLVHLLSGVELFYCLTNVAVATILLHGTDRASVEYF